jgi:hypothetical protein
MVFSVVPAPSCPGDACLIGAAGEPAFTPTPLLVCPMLAFTTVMVLGFAYEVRMLTTSQVNALQELQKRRCASNIDAIEYGVSSRVSTVF